MASGTRKGQGIHDRNICDSAGIRPHKLDLTFSSASAFLAEKDNGGFNSSSAQAGDCFFHTGENALWTYNGTNWERNVKGRSRFLQFTTEPLSVKKTGAGAATGTAGDENLFGVPGGTFEYHILGTQTIVAPSLGTAGLNVSLDQTDNDGVEVCPGITARSDLAFVVGTSPAFYAELKFKIADVSGTDDCAFGFRKAEAYQANIDDYDEMACLNVISGDIKIETILNNAATTTTDTTDNWADAATHTLKVLVSAAGVVTYQIDGAAPTTTAAFTFDNAEVVVPFFYFLHAADVAGAVELVHFDCGLQ